MALLVAVLLALFVAPRPWGWLLVGLAAVYEVVSNWWSWRWSRAQKAVGPGAALVGRELEIDADGWGRLDGERWQVRGAGPGERARVVAVEGLVLVVTPSAHSRHGV